MKALTVFFGAALAAIAAVPVVGAALTPLIRKPPGGSSDFLAAGSVDELEVGVPRRVELTATVVDGWSRSLGVVGAAWLLKRPDGKVEALSSVCPHSGCTIDSSTPPATPTSCSSPPP